jgi:translation initiation factor 2 subunit 2
MSDLGFDPTLKKKKKVKKVEGTASPTPELADFNGLKKKKKTKKLDEDEDKEGSVEVDMLNNSLGDLSLKKKKKKSTKIVEAIDFEQQLEQARLDDTNTTTSTPTEELSPQEASGFPYEQLLSRFFQILKKNNPELAGDRSGPKFRIPPPICQREGSKKTLFANVQDIATVLQRNPEHLIQFLFAELGTSGSIDGEKRLVLKGKFQPKQMESVLRRYIIEYVTCKTCKSMNTELKRESANRLHFLSCKACGSTRSVSSIKTGFQAQIGRRKKM